MHTLCWSWLLWASLPFRKGEYRFEHGRLRYIQDWYNWIQETKSQCVSMDKSLQPVTVILLSYKRPWNMKPIVWSLLQCEWASRIFVVNNNPKIDIRRYVPFANSRITCINEDHNYGAMRRYEIAQQKESQYYLCIDDDIFFTPLQMTKLIRHLIANPSVPHGMFGQYIYLDAHPLQRWKHSVHGRECSVDILNRTYAFTHTHVQEFFRLLRCINQDTPEARKEMSPLDDVILSFCGNTKPHCHDVGGFIDCPSSSAQSIAQWQQNNFSARRTRLYTRLHGIKPLTSSIEYDA